MAERSLGQFLAAGKRSHVTIATKVGFPARVIPERIPQWMYVERASAMALTRVGVRYRPARPRALSESAAERSFTDSLRALRSTSVDILFVHDPSPTELPLLAALAEWLDRQRTTGRARYVGLAGNAVHCVAIAEALPGIFDILQVEDSLTTFDADVLQQAGWPFQSTFGYLRLARRAKENDKESSPGTLVISNALTRNSAGMVLVSTRQIDRIPSLAAIAEASVR